MIVTTSSRVSALIGRITVVWTPDNFEGAGMRRVVWLAGMFVAACGAQETPAPARPAVPLYDNLGDHAHAITTTSPEAQKYFNQGLMLSYAFNHAEAIRAFRHAASLDPDCAMCYWGVAFALGPNINAPITE